MSSGFKRRALVTTFILWVFSTGDARADQPLVGYIFPAGGQRGTVVEARIGGCNLYDAPKLFWSGEGIASPATISRTETIWFEGPLIPQPPSQQREDYPKDYAVALKIDDSASVGVRGWRLATSQGVTAPWGFIVGDFPEVVEQEVDGETPAVPVKLPVTINGRIFPREDVDTWSFTATAGQIVTCHVATSEFGSPLDACISLFDDAGQKLAESIPTGDVTPILRCTIPASGEYRVRIHDVAYQGFQNHVYRLTVTTGPFLDSVYPVGGRRGSSTRLQLNGVNLNENEITWTVPTTGSETVFRLPEPQTSFGSAKFELDDLDEFLELEGEGQASAGQIVAVPAVFNGRIRSAGEEDVWKFTASKAQELDFDVCAARCGSPLDPVIRLCDVDGKTIQEVDDSPGLQTDARLRWTAPQDGEYRLAIRDRLASRGDLRFAYRIRVTDTTSVHFALKLAVDSITIEQGQSANVKVTIDRSPGFKSPVELAFEDLPPGVTVTSPTVIAANVNELPITFKVDKEAKATVAALRVSGSATVGDQSIKRFATTLATSSGPDAVSVADADGRLWISVAIPTPFKFVGQFESKYIPRGSVYVRKYRIERNGFTGPLEVQLADRQGRHLQGVTASPVVVPANESEFEFAVTLPSWMEVGRTCRSTLSISGVTTDADGTLHTISYSSNDQHNQMIALVATGQLGIQLTHSTLTAVPGETLNLPFRIQRSPGIAGPVQVELIIPKGVGGLSVSSPTLESGQNEGVLAIAIDKQTPATDLAPLTIRATTLDTRSLPVTGEAKLTLVQPVRKKTSQ